MKDSPSARSIAARHEAWEKRLPESDKDLWDALMLLDGGDQAALFAHCASFGVNALWEPTSRYDGRVSAHGVERRLAHSHVLARARSEEHTSELQSLMRISYAVFCLKKKKHTSTITTKDGIK